MNSLIGRAKELLEDAKFRTVPPRGQGDSLHFENAALVGGIVLFASGQELFAGWRGRQDQFFASHAASLRTARRKAWNAYQIFLWEGVADDSERRACIQIEEDLTTARKIAVAVNDEAGIQRALAPLLPLQRIPRRASAEDEVNIALRLEGLGLDAARALIAGQEVRVVWQLLLER